MTMNACSTHWSKREAEAASKLISLALEEDLGTVGDLTSQLLFTRKEQGKAIVMGRKAGILAGLPLVEMVFRAVNPGIEVKMLTNDGEQVQNGTRIAEVTGEFRDILIAERTMLNFLQRLSGVATLTSIYVEKLKGYKAKLLDTRKTTPGYRLLEKYAVRCGGGHNHRMGLYDGVMLKDNHIGGLRQNHRDLKTTLDMVKEKVPAGTMVEVEVDTLELLKQAIDAGASLILLDNMNLEQLKEAVQIRDQKQKGVELEASGGVNLETIREIAATGVDRISVGAITHSATALDIALDYEQ